MIPDPSRPHVPTTATEGGSRSPWASSTAETTQGDTDERDSASDGAAFFGLRATGQGRWELPVTPEICSSRRTIFGGSAVGAAAEALELTTGQPLRWATVQFLTFARPPQGLALEVDVLAEHDGLVHARLRARTHDADVFLVTAALGCGPDAGRGVWARPTTSLPPSQCPARPKPSRHIGTVMDRVETRLAVASHEALSPGQLGPGRGGLWVRVPDLPVSAAALGLVGDLVPSGMRYAVDRRIGGQSLDNSLRVLRLAPTDWYFVDVRVHGIGDGVAHTLAHLWSEDDVLLGTASQSTAVREF